MFKKLETEKTCIYGYIIESGILYMKNKNTEGQTITLEFVEYAT